MPRIYVPHFAKKGGNFRHRPGQRLAPNSPLTNSDDAIVIDTSELDLTEVFETMLSHIDTKQGLNVDLTNAHL